MKPKIMIVAGGTGGHVFPGLAVALRLRSEGAVVTWIGTGVGLEANCVPEANIPFYSITVKNVRGKGWLRLLSMPFMLTKSLFQSIVILNRVAPDVVLSMGGYVAGPVGLAAWILRIPLVVHEQNAIFGLTNRLLSRFAKKVMVAFPDMGKSAKYIQTGNPIRPEIKALALTTKPPRTQERLQLLVIGGSLGALAINQVLPKALALIPEAERPLVWHQTGVAHFETTQAAYAAAGVEAKLSPFIRDMDAAYAWADLLIARAGALTLAEVTAMGLPSFLVPFPYAVDDHQTANAKGLDRAGGTQMIPQTLLTPDYLATLIQRLYQDPALRLKMGSIAKEFAKINATEIVAEHCLEVFREKRA